MSGGIKRRRSTWLQCDLVIVPERILSYLSVAGAHNVGRAKTGSDASLFTLSLPIHAPLLF